LAPQGDERIYRRVSIGVLTVEYSFPNGSLIHPHDRQHLTGQPLAPTTMWYI
jgi:hypothetical protein